MAHIRKVTLRMLRTTAEAKDWYRDTSVESSLARLALQIICGVPSRQLPPKLVATAQGYLNSGELMGYWRR